MGDLLATGAAWMDGKRKAYMGSLISYTRAAGGSPIPVIATIGKSSHEQRDEYGVTIKIEMVDFIVSVADLNEAGVRFDPRRGDTITRTLGDTVVIYEVLPPNDGTPEYGPSDPHGNAVRIHTKQVATQNV